MKYVIPTEHSKTEENCVPLTQEKEKAINETVDKIIKYLVKMQGELNDIDIKMLTIEIDRHSDQEKDDKELKLKVTVDYCDEKDNTNNTSGKKQKNYRRHHKRDSKFLDPSLISDTKESDVSDDKTKDLKNEDSNAEIENDHSVVKISDTSSDDSTAGETNSEVITDTIEQNNSNREKKRKHHHKKKPNKTIGDDTVSDILEKINIDSIITNLEKSVVKNKGHPVENLGDSKKQKHHHKRKHHKNIENNDLYTTDATQSIYGDKSVSLADLIDKTVTESINPGKRNGKHKNHKSKDNRLDSDQVTDIFKRVFNTDINLELLNPSYYNSMKADENDSTKTEVILPEKKKHKHKNHKSKNNPLGNFEGLNILSTISALNDESSSTSNPNSKEDKRSPGENENAESVVVQKNNKHKSHKPKDISSSFKLTDIFKNIFNTIKNEEPSSTSNFNSKDDKGSPGRNENAESVVVRSGKTNNKHKSHQPKDMSSSFQLTDILKNIFNKEKNEEPSNLNHSNAKESEVQPSDETDATVTEAEPAVKPNNKHKNRKRKNAPNGFQFIDVLKNIFNTSSNKEPSATTNIKSKEAEISTDESDATITEGVLPGKKENKHRNQKSENTPEGFQFIDILKNIFNTGANKKSSQTTNTKSNEAEAISADKSDTTTESVLPGKKTNKHKNKKYKDNLGSYQVTDLNLDSSNENKANSMTHADESDTAKTEGVLPKKKNHKHKNHKHKDTHQSDAFDSIFNTENNEESSQPTYTDSKVEEVSTSVDENDSTATEGNFLDKINNKHKNHKSNENSDSTTVIEEQTNPTDLNSKEDILYDNKAVLIDDDKQEDEAKNDYKKKHPHVINDENVNDTEEKDSDKSDTVYVMTSPVPHYSNENDNDDNTDTDHPKTVDEETHEKKHDHNKKQHHSTTANNEELNKNTNYSEDNNAQSDNGTDETKEETVTNTEDEAAYDEKYEKHDKKHEEIDDKKEDVTETTDQPLGSDEEITEEYGITHEEIRQRYGNKKSHHITVDDFKKYVENNDDTKRKCVCIHDSEPEWWY